MSREYISEEISMMKNESLLFVRNLKAGYDDSAVLLGIDLEVAKGEMLAVVGPNGAGKSTFLRCISGLLPIREGSILYKGSELAGTSCLERAKLGITLCLEGGKVFPEMNIEDNLLTGGHLRKNSERRERLCYAYDLFPILRDRRNQIAGTLSGGERQMVSLGRALMSKPTLLMLDEPSFGLAPITQKVIYEAITRINKEENLSVLLIEQDAVLALQNAKRGYAIQNGRVAMKGSSQELLKSDLFKKVYLGL
jgi:branched-chain amino acid transport system ATP-binding protein